MPAKYRPFIKYSSVTAAIILWLIAASTARAENNCAATASVKDFYTQGWGYQPSNQRFQPRTTIDKTNVNRLSLSWTFILEGGSSPHSYPVVSEDTLFIGTQSGKLYALDIDNGCIRWTYEAGDSIRTGVVHGLLPTATGQQAVLFFGTTDGHTHAVDAATGAGRWVTDIAEHSMTMQTGTPLYHDGQLFVPVSSTELVYAFLPWYGCCTFRGSLIALDAATGTTQWRTYTIEQQAEVTGTHSFFVQMHGPSGAPIWSSPTVDEKRGLVLVGTGENYSSPASRMSDAIIAMDIKTGAIRWFQQYLANDAFNTSCAIPAHPNCPKEDGPDFDFGAPPILTQTAEGADIILAGQKSGGVYALDPATGKRIWEQFFGRGGLLGGIHWGMAVNPYAGLLFVPINDKELFYKTPAGDPKPALHALDIATGAIRWSVAMEDTCKDRAPCYSGLSAAIAATPELVFAGSLDAHIRAYDAVNGQILWDFDSWKTFTATNGKLANGGAIDVHGPMIADHRLFIQSGYAGQGMRGGNALLAFSIGGPD
jgi:polyvinyl alcohol dehydrogenase (cytochrome)